MGYRGGWSLRRIVSVGRGEWLLRLCLQFAPAERDLHRTDHHPSYAGQATNFAWCNAACAHDEQLRAITLASMNVGSNVLAAWWGLVFCE